MALRSGYYGLKNATKKILEKLAADTAGMKIIKSFGDGLSLSNAGKLNTTAATANKLGTIKVGQGLSIENGVLSVDSSGGGMIYSTTEVATGEKWYDDSDIYTRTFIFESAKSISDGQWNNMNIEATGVRQIISGELWGTDGSSHLKVGRGGLAAFGVNTSGNFEIYSRMGGTATGFMVRYVKETV